jgi:hypothetical protein
VDAAAALMGRLKYERSLRFVWVTGYELALQVTLVLSAMLGIVCHTKATWCLAGMVFDYDTLFRHIYIQFWVPPELRIFGLTTFPSDFWLE